MTSAGVPDIPRRTLSGRRPEMAARLLEAVPPLIAEIGYEDLTVRAVAKAAGVSAATAYSYFGSKEHLLAETYWRRVAALPEPRIRPTARLAKRVEAAVEPIALAVADEPELAAGVTTALLAHDPDVRQIREQLGHLMADRLNAALGKDGSPQVLQALTLQLTGALMAAGMGMLAYRDLPAVMAAGAGLMARAS